MATLLLIVIYIGFIGLGVPDSLFGAAWPAIYGEFQLPVSYNMFVSLTCSVCTLLASLFSSRVINRFGTAKVTAVSTAMTALALLLASVSQNFIFLVLLAIPLGFGGGAIDAGLNNYVALHYNAMQMSFLHCFYGVGVSISPYLLSFALKGEGGWRGGYQWVAVLQIAISTIVIFTLPLWKKVAQKPGMEEEKPVTLTIPQLFKVKGLKPVWLMFFTSCTVEYLCNAWGATFLVEHKGLTRADAAGTVTLYFVGLAVGRFLSGVLSGKLTPKKLVILGQIFLVTAILLLFLPTSPGIALFLVGLGIGPIYPNLMHLTPSFFGRETSQSVMGSQMAAASLAFVLTPFVFAPLAQNIGLWLFPIYLAVMALLLVVGTATSKLKNIR